MMGQAGEPRGAIGSNEWGARDDGLIKNDKEATCDLI